MSGRKAPEAHLLKTSSLHWLSILVLLPCLLLLASVRSIHSNELISDAKKSKVVTKIEVLAQLMARGSPSLEQTLGVLEGRATESKNDHYIMVAGPGHRTILTIVKIRGESFVSELSIYPDFELGLQLKDLSETLGMWKKIYQSKRSSVRFEYSDSQLKGIASIYVVLLLPPSEPTSPVLTVDIRRE